MVLPKASRQAPCAQRQALEAESPHEPPGAQPQPAAEQFLVVRRQQAVLLQRERPAAELLELHQ